MMDEQFYVKLKERIFPYFEGTNPAHDFMHTERVVNMALKIAEEENADLDIIELSALLHDIARKEEDESCGKICHAEKGAELANQILKEFGYSEDKIKKVCHCIECHRKKKNKLPQSIEAKILFDADKIDAIGAIGIGRLFSFAGFIRAVVHNPKVNLQTTKSYTKDDSAYREFLLSHQNLIEKIITNTGKKIANERWRFMEEFFKRINMEVEGIL